MALALINTARALDDPRFLWRVRAALLERAATKVRIASTPVIERLYAEYILSNPMTPDPRMEAMVATTDTVAEAVTVDQYNTVSTEGVTDDQIAAAVNTAFITVATLMFSPTVVDSDPEE